MTKLFFLITVFIIAFCDAEGGTCHNPLTTRIYGGHAAEAGEFPWQVQLNLNGNHYCGGSIINSQWILTACHCTTKYPQFLLTVYVGSIFLNQTGGTSHNVTKIIRNEKYDNQRFTNDIALLKIAPPISEESFKSGNAAKIELETEYVEVANATVSGWGWINDKGTLPDVLQYLDMTTVSLANCQYNFINAVQPILSSQICAAAKNEAADCRGDSGGPLVRDRKQIGIVSWGNEKCGQLPSVYTRVSSFVPWIFKAMSSN